MSARVLHGGRGIDYRRPRAIVRAQAQQPPQHERHIGAEYAPVGMAFIDDDELQVPQQPRPSGMRRQQGHMHHIRVGKNEPRMIAYARAGFLRRIAVIGCGHHGLERRNPPAQLQHRLQLIRTQRLSGGEIQRASGRLLRQTAQNGQLVAQGLSRRSAGSNHRILAFPGGLCELSLVPIQLADAPFYQLLPQLRQYPLRPLRILGALWRQGGLKGESGLIEAALDEFEELFSQGIIRFRVRQFLPPREFGLSLWRGTCHTDIRPMMSWCGVYTLRYC